MKNCAIVDSSVNENVTQGSQSQVNTRPTELKDIKLPANEQLSEVAPLRLVIKSSLEQQEQFRLGT